MPKNNKEYLHGYTMGYDYMQYEGGSQYSAKYNIMDRGIPLRSVYAVAFLAAVKDYLNGIPRKYN